MRKINTIGEINTMVKRNTIRKTALILVFVLLTTALGACKSKDNKSEDKASDNNSNITIAIVPKALDNPIFLDTKEGGEARGEELNITIEWTGSSVSDAAQQVAVMEELIKKGVDGILVSCNDADALKDVINRAVDAGIVVATFDSDSPDSKRSFYIGSDNGKIGKKCADYINELIPDGGKLAVLTGVLGAMNLEARITGLKDNLNSNIEVLPIQSCDDDIQKSVDIVNEYTAANTDLAGWVFVGGWPFNVEPDSLAGLKKFMEDGGVCISVDTTYPMLQFVQLDMAQVLIGQDYNKMGSDGVQYLYEMIKNGKKPSGDFIDTGYEIVDKNNVEEVLSTKTPW